MQIRPGAAVFVLFEHATALASIGAMSQGKWHERPPPVGASVPIATDPNKYDPSVLLALNPIKVYESIISSGIAGDRICQWSFALCDPGWVGI